MNSLGVSLRRVQRFERKLNFVKKLARTRRGYIICRKKKTKNTAINKLNLIVSFEEESC